jgi:ribonuclease HI
LITHMPNHADLSTWARQGVLLLNMALTIAPDAKHMKVWKKYMEHIVVALRAAYPQLIFVLFGGKAAAAIDSAIPGGSAQMLCWAHPSPASTHNNDKTAPSHFINCTVFTAVNTILGRLKQSPINWNSVNAPEAHHLFDDLVCAQELGVDYLPPVPHDEIMWIFTDGAASANGKANCRASWAYSIVWKSPINICYKNAYGNVVECEDAKPSNNRGELLAILNALKTIDQIYGANIATTPQIAICTDSQYSIGCISVWAGNWLKQAAQAERKNLDLIYPAHHIYKKYGTKIVFTHIRSHRPPPPKEEGLEFFKWRGNELADSLCSLAQLGAAQ